MMNLDIGGLSCKCGPLASSPHAAEDSRATTASLGAPKPGLCHESSSSIYPCQEPFDTAWEFILWKNSVPDRERRENCQAAEKQAQRRRTDGRPRSRRIATP